jgi:hypothetical protein
MPKAPATLMIPGPVDDHSGYRHDAVLDADIIVTPDHPVLTTGLVVHTQYTALTPLLYAAPSNLPYHKPYPTACSLTINPLPN